MTKESKLLLSYKRHLQMVLQFAVHGMEGTYQITQICEFINDRRSTLGTLKRAERIHLLKTEIPAKLDDLTLEEIGYLLSGKLDEMFNPEDPRITAAKMSAGAKQWYRLSDDSKATVTSELHAFILGAAVILLNDQIEKLEAFEDASIVI